MTAGLIVGKPLKATIKHYMIHTEKIELGSFCSRFFFCGKRQYKTEYYIGST